MGQPARQHIGDDLHIGMAMGPKAAAAGHPVVVDHPQGSKAHVCGVVVVAKRETVMGIEPAEISVATICGFAKGEHDGAI